MIYNCTLLFGFSLSSCHHGHLWPKPNQHPQQGIKRRNGEFYASHQIGNPFRKHVSGRRWSVTDAIRPRPHEVCIDGIAKHRHLGWIRQHCGTLLGEHMSYSYCLVEHLLPQRQAYFVNRIAGKYDSIILSIELINYLNILFKNRL